MAEKPKLTTLPTPAKSDHFEILSSGLLRAKTEIGEATIKILDLNHPDSIIERLEMI